MTTQLQTLQEAYDGRWPFQMNISFNETFPQLLAFQIKLASTFAPNLSSERGSVFWAGAKKVHAFSKATSSNSNIVQSELNFCCDQFPISEVCVVLEERKLDFFSFQDENLPISLLDRFMNN